MLKITSRPKIVKTRQMTLRQKLISDARIGAREGIKKTKLLP